MIGLLAAAYIALIPLARPHLPANLHVADLLFPVLAIATLHRHRGPWQLRPLDYAVIAYLLALVPSFLATDDLRASGFELIKRVYLAGVYAIFAMYFRSEGYVVAFKAIVYAAVAVCAFGVAVAAVYLLTHVFAPQLLLPMPVPYIGTVPRLWLFAESPAMVANYLTFALPFLLAAGLAGVLRRGARIGSLGAMATVAMLTFSHSLGGFVAAGFSTLWPLARGPRARVLRAAGAVATIVVVLVFNAMLVVTIRRIAWRADFDDSVPKPAAMSIYEFQQNEGARRLSLQVSYNPMNYYLLKQVAWRAFLERPWAGFGLDRFRALTDRAVDERRIHDAYRVADPHSTLLGALAETGVFGALTIAAIFVIALVPRRRPDGSPAGWFAVASQAAIIGLAVNGLNADVMNFRFLWVGLAVLRN